MVASRQKEAAGINLDAYYDAVEETLKEQYVEPIKSENKLAIGAIHGMITSLSDPNSRYMDKEAFASYVSEQEGHFAGIGADFTLESTGVDLSGDEQVLSDTDPTSDFAATRIPRLTLNSVVPGGPADKVGAKGGDWISGVDGHWVIDSVIIETYRKLGKSVKRLADGSVDYSTPEGKAYQAKTRELRQLGEAAIFPERALTILSMGSSGKVSVTLSHDGQPDRTVTIEKANVDGTGNTVAGDVVKLRFGHDAPTFLKSAIGGKSAVTLDLRNQPVGYFDAMMASFKLVAPAGSYGTFQTLRKGENPSPLKLAEGNPNPPKLTLLVDGSVRGPAAIFALALSSKGLAKLEGSEVAADRTRMLVEGLPDGSGYTLVTGQYHPASATVAQATKRSKS